MIERFRRPYEISCDMNAGSRRQRRASRTRPHVLPSIPLRNSETPIEEVLRARFRGAPAGERTRELSTGDVEAKQRRTCSITTIFCSTWHTCARADPRRRPRPPLRSCARRRVSRHEPAAGVDPVGDQTWRPGSDGGRRRCRVDLFVSGRHGRNILDFPSQFSPPAEIITLDRNYRSTQPILFAANAVIDLVVKRFTKNLWTDRTSAERPQLVTVRDDTDQARYIVERCWTIASAAPC